LSNNSSTNKSRDEGNVVLQKWVEGTTINKLSKTKWQAVLSDGSIVMTDENDFLNKTKLYVKKALS
jgi:hypothetical protein